MGLPALDPSNWEETVESVHRFYESGAAGRTEAEADLSPVGFGLEDLGRKFQPSKQIHNYLLRYDHVFGPFRHNVRTMVEVGVQSERSVRMWKEYFPNALIIGIDIDERCKAFEEDRIQIIIGSQTDTQFLTDFGLQHYGKLDVVVDDGAHSQDAIFKTFTILYPALQPHGVYAVEDLLYGPKWISPQIQKVVEAINFWPPGFPVRNWSALDDLGENASWLARNTIGLEFYRYILFVKRGLNPKDNPHLLSQEALYRKLNGYLIRIGAAADRLSQSGSDVTKDKLMSELGNSFEQFIDEFLKGTREYKRSDNI